jgi:glycolate oxidase FAD binding subunit
VRQLVDLLKPYGEVLQLDHETSLAFWGECRRLSFLGDSRDPVWRISTAPVRGPQVVKALTTYTPCKIAYDWSGGLIWAEVPQTADASAADVRRVVAVHGGHATLMRADAAVRAAVDVFQPLEPAIQRLSRSIKDTFDPAGILNPGRMYLDT